MAAFGFDMECLVKLRVHKSWSWLTIATFVVAISKLRVTASSSLIEEFACFNSVFNIHCESNEKIIFESGRFGRNHTDVAIRCGVRYQRNCDVDVLVILNRACAGKSDCTLAVNTGLFNDPCGYDEFLHVSYRCASASSIQQTCYRPNGRTLYDHGFIASPNYPYKYYMDDSCLWTLSVQRRQTIRITILDFELVAKRGGVCHDSVQISTSDKVYFEECGVIGKEVIEVDDNTATVLFRSGLSSLTDRGFMLHFEAVGPGCPDLEHIAHGIVEYYIEDGTLYANATCDYGYYFTGTSDDRMRIECTGSKWSDIVHDCAAMPPATSPRVIVMNTTPVSEESAAVDQSMSLIGIALGVVSAILLISLLLILALYVHRRRRNEQQKMDQWRVVVNNLQADIANEDNCKRHDEMSMASYCQSYKPSPVCSNVRRTYQKNRSTPEDEWQAKNLLRYGYDEEDTCFTECPDYDYTTPVKYPDERNPSPVCPGCSRTNSITKPQVPKYVITNSRDSMLDSTIIYDQPPVPKPAPMYVIAPKPVPPPRPPPRKDFHHKRARSGQWDPPKKIATYTPVQSGVLTQEKRPLSRSAPDLITMLPPIPPADCCMLTGCPRNSSFDQSPARIQYVPRSTTLYTIPKARYASVPKGNSSKGKAPF